MVSGHPYWRGFRNRILGPYAVQGLSYVFPDYLAAHAAFSIAALVAAGLLAWRLGWIIGGDKNSAVLAFLVLQIGFVFFLAPPWLYVWDFIGLVVFLVFIEFVLTQRPWPWFAGLFAVAIFNRESAGFIALWMILDPFVRWGLNKYGPAKNRAAPDWTMAITGSVCLTMGIVLVELLRWTLMIEETGPGLFPNAVARNGFLFPNELMNNLHAFTQVATTVRHGFQTPVIFFPLAIAAMAIRLGWLYPQRLLSLALVHGAFLASLFMIGAVLESRVYLELLPLLIAGTVILTNRPPVGAGPGIQ